MSGLTLFSKLEIFGSFVSCVWFRMAPTKALLAIFRSVSREAGFEAVRARNHPERRFVLGSSRR